MVWVWGKNHWHNKFAKDVEDQPCVCVCVCVEHLATFLTVMIGWLSGLGCPGVMEMLPFRVEGLSAGSFLISHRTIRSSWSKLWLPTDGVPLTLFTDFGIAMVMTTSSMILPAHCFDEISMSIFPPLSVYVMTGLTESGTRI